MGVFPCGFFSKALIYGGIYMAKKAPKMIKTVYFDEQSARDYIDVINGGRFDWSTAEDKERIAKIIAEIDAEIGHGFNLFSWIKASAAGKISGEYDREAKRAIETKLTNTLLTDYITIACKDKNISRFTDVVYAPKTPFHYIECIVHIRLSSQRKTCLLIWRD